MLKPADVKRIRSKLGLSQSALAERMGLDRSAIAQWECGNTSPRGPSEILLRQFESQVDAQQAVKQPA